MKKRVGVTFLTLLMCLMVSISVTANSPAYTVHMLANTNIWFGGYPVTRSQNNNYVSVKLKTIYPTSGGTDNYHNVYSRVQTTNGINISDTVYLTEGSGYTNITLYNGYLRQSEVEFLFKNCYQKALSMEIDCRGN